MKQLRATVYRQDAPKVTIPLRKFNIDGMTFHEHTASLVCLGDVRGTYDECWKQAKQLCAAPVLDWHGAIRYKEA